MCCVAPKVLGKYRVRFPVTIPPVLRNSRQYETGGRRLNRRICGMRSESPIPSFVAIAFVLRIRSWLFLLLYFEQVAHDTVGYEYPFPRKAQGIVFLD